MENIFVQKYVALYKFWHGFDWDNRKKDFKSHQEFWIPKIEKNKERDREVTRQLEEEGWLVLRFWGKEIKKETDKCADCIQHAIEERKHV